jgi:phage gpG-like protein
MSITGSFRELDRLIRFADRLRQPQFAEGLAKNLGQAALNQIDESFAGQKDPWDRPWKPSARAEATGGQTLRKTARLQRSMTSQSALKTDPQGFEIGTNVVYAATHQYGATITPQEKKALRFKAGKRWVTVTKVKIPARPFMPEPELSPRWERAFEEAAEAYLREVP